MEQFANVNEEQKELFADDEDFQEAPVVKPSPFADSPYEMLATPMQPAKKKRKAKSAGKCWGKRILAAVLTVALVIGACSATAYFINCHWEQKMKTMQQSMDNKLQMIKQELQSQNAVQPGGSAVQSGDYMTPRQVYAQNVGAVVAVSNQGVTTNIYGQASKTASSGSGFIISADGYVVSNYHVVQGATKLTVITSAGEEYDAKVVGFDAENDISLMKIEAQNLPFVTLGSSDALAIGDQVAAIGNPLGELTSTLTVGYVSAKDRLINTEGKAINMLQTDAAINSGNSGGPLFNMHGEVIGITTAKFSGTSKSGASIEGIGFAIPIDDVAGMLDDLLSRGYITSAYLGVMVRDVDTTAQAYGLPAGAYVDEVISGYAAEEAGMKAQDIIVELGGYEIRSASDLTRVLRKFEIGQATTVTVYRAGQQVTLQITLDEKPRETAPTQPDQPEQVAPTAPEEEGQSEMPWWFNWNPFFG